MVSSFNELITRCRVSAASFACSECSGAHQVSLSVTAAIVLSETTNGVGVSGLTR